MMNLKIRWVRLGLLVKMIPLKLNLELVQKVQKIQYLFQHSLLKVVDLKFM